jgi:menaquinone-dependent protoporphyrinogen IX oxidase
LEVLDLPENKTLVAYVTKGGATRDYAVMIAGVLKDEYNLDVDLIDLGKTKSPDLSQYRNIVLGTGVRMFKVYKEAVKFIEKNSFEGKHVAVFISSGKAGNPKTYDDAVQDYINKQMLGRNLNLKPVAAEAFGGRTKILGKDMDPPGYAEQVRVKVHSWAEELGKKLTT